MEKRKKTLELRERLDKTLAMPDLLNPESLKSLVRDQLLRSPVCGNEGDIGEVVEKRTMEVSNLLEMLRSASGNERKAVKAHDAPHNDWKLKQDTDQLRVMYREAHGTPFHTLLAEGHADGPIDVCLCVSWESTLYKKWWPEYNIPTFKITTATCVQKIRVGEEISLIRVKVPWPVSDREVVLHYFEIEYFEGDLIIVILNTISDTEHIDVSTHGFSRDGIPDARDTVRIDMVGGLVLQKVDDNRSYFRVIANMDIKLDFVPPWLINFISRQLIGNGHKLYQKAVGSVATNDEDYRRALEGPMYARIREALDSCNQPNTASVGLDLKKPKVLSEKQRENILAFKETTPIAEIVEEETEESQCSDGNQIMNGSSNDLITTGEQPIFKERVSVSPEVEEALRILDRAISIVRGDCSPSVDQEVPTLQTVAEAGPASHRDSPKNSSNTDTKAPSENLGSLPADHFRLDPQKPITEDTASLMVQPPIMENMRKVCDEGSLRANGFHENKSKPKRSWKKNRWVCC